MEGVALSTGADASLDATAIEYAKRLVALRRVDFHVRNLPEGFDVNDELFRGAMLKLKMDVADGSIIFDGPTYEPIRGIDTHYVIFARILDAESGYEERLWGMQVKKKSAG